MQLPFAKQASGAHNYVQVFQQAHAAQNYGLAHDAFKAAIAADADYAYRAMAAPNGALSDIAEKLNKTDEIVSLLDAAFPSAPHMHMMCENKPDVIRHVLNLREENLARGMPSVVLVTMEKSGSVSLANIFTSGLNLPSFAYSFLNLQVVESWARDYARGGCCYVTHLRPYRVNIARLMRAGISKMIVHVRDPRQALLSRIHHVEHYRDAFPETNNEEFRQMDMDSKLRVMFGFYLHCISWIEGWAKAAQDIEIMFSTFEDFVADRDRLMQRYLDFYGPKAASFSAPKAFTEHEGIDYHKRLGEVDEWRRVFSQKSQNLLSSLLEPELKEKFGWK